MPVTTDAAIRAALDEAWRAAAIAEAVIARFGPVMPFRNLLISDYLHAATLIRLLAARGFSAPERPVAAPPALPEDLSAACRMAADGAVAAIGCYEGRLLPAVRGDPDAEAVLMRLHDALRHVQLPTLLHWAEMHGCPAPAAAS
ncbi:hypothetical protein P7L74_12295 [Tistrella mobilis]|uniref:DUF2202 domain-containing protein n=1 Tax=Tistrella mobilis TaxID=171437 RepID=UPI0035579DBB